VKGCTVIELGKMCKFCYGNTFVDFKIPAWCPCENFLAFSLLVLMNDLTGHMKFHIEMEYARSGHSMVFAY
jgi:hypothetical protein